jgi:hypothetical protein
MMSASALIQNFIAKLQNSPSQISFDETLQIIEQHYDFTPVGFDNGPLQNAAGTNQGSCKIFAFSQIHQLSEAQTLACFGDFYRIDVLQHPDNEDHANIRQFMRSGLAGILFEVNPLSLKTP